MMTSKSFPKPYCPPKNIESKVTHHINRKYFKERYNICICALYFMFMRKNGKRIHINENVSSWLGNDARFVEIGDLSKRVIIQGIL